MERKIIRYGSACIGLLLAGCIMGGALDTPTNQPIQPPPHTDPDPDPDPANAAKRLYPTLKTGEKWVFVQWNGGDSGATATFEVVGDSVIGADSVYVEQISVKVPNFVDADGILNQNFRQTGRLYLRKSDQEAVHDTLVTQIDLWFPGEDSATRYREEAWSMTGYTGTLPDSLVDGATWQLAGTRHIKIVGYVDGRFSGQIDTTLTRTRNYAAFASPDIAVKAGTFPAVRLEWSDAGSTAKTTGWYSAAAKAMVRQIDPNGASSDTTDLASYLLK